METLRHCGRTEEPYQSNPSPSFFRSDSINFIDLSAAHFSLLLPRLAAKKKIFLPRATQIYSLGDLEVAGFSWMERGRAARPDNNFNISPLFILRVLNYFLLLFSFQSGFLFRGNKVNVCLTEFVM